ncbi:MAG: prolipoprotein diacylglyceryl transferase [Muribaculaceae bacterium]|nr:prolipoprotein diacylglyceryl transferase [Muribaculaceae bacterium]
MLNFITWTADPILLDTSFVDIRWYSLMFLIGFLGGYKIVEKIFKHEGAPESWLGSLLIWVMAGTIIGARLGHVFFYEWDQYSQNPMEIFKVWEGGLASHGGTIGVAIAVILFSRFTTKRNSLWTFDRLAVAVAMVAGLIRLGNLFNHEIYGHATDVPWAFCFIDNIRAWQAGAEPIFTAPSHPTQLYEALCYFALFGLLMWLYWKKNAQERQGLLLGIFFVWVFGSRFLIEFVKNNQVAWEESMTLNMGQWLSIPFVLIGIALIIYAMKRPRIALEYPNKFPDESNGKKK